MTALPCIGVVAPSGTGKTTLLQALAPCLRAHGLRIGYLKHTHHDVDLDQPGKDSYRLRAAGAAQVLLVSDRRWALLTEQAGTPSLDVLLGQFDAARLDLVLIEGLRGDRYPKIEVLRGAAWPRCADDPDLLAVASKQPLAVAPWPVLPLDDAEAIARFIIEQLAAGRLAFPAMARAQSQ